MIGRRPGRTRYAIVMNGEGSSCSNHSPVRSARTLGAKGRKGSRCLILRFNVSFILGERGSQTMERLPSERGPNSMRPWNHPMMPPPAILAAASSISSSSGSQRYSSCAASRASLHAPSEKEGPRQASRITQPRGKPRAWCHTQSAAPIAVGVNILRIMATSLVHEAVDSPRVDAFFHDFAGWLARMPWERRVQALFGQVSRRCDRHGYLTPGEEHPGQHPKRGALPAAADALPA